jgi:hypothetical protein
VRYAEVRATRAAACFADAEETAPADDDEWTVATGDNERDWGTER